MDEHFKVPALFIGEIEDDINLSLPPASGEEYIKRVILEARECDDVAYAKIDEKRLKKPTLNVKPLPECAKAPDYMNPTLEWQQFQVADFSNLRMYIAQLRDQITNQRCNRKLLKEKLPQVDDQDAWIDLCVRKKQIEPTLTVILSINQSKVERVLEYLVEALENEVSISLHLGRWLYALLAALKLPLTPDVHSCLRSFARICSKMRSKLDSSNANDALPLNLFICLVARYFRQLDLADI